MNTFFTSDHHLGHRLVADKRGFASVEAHDAALAQYWDAVVGTGDTVWVLGDLTLGPLHKALDWFTERPGRLKLIFGNHDEGHPMHRDAHKLQSDYLDVFEYVATGQRIRIAGVNILLSHFPYPGTSEGTDEHGRPFDDRYSQWRLPNEGLPLIHGHTHRDEKVSWNPLGWKSTPQIHVGLDAWELRPVMLRDVEDELSRALACR